METKYSLLLPSWVNASVAFNLSRIFTLLTLPTDLTLTLELHALYILLVSEFYLTLIFSIGVVAMGTLGTKALPDKERNLSTRNQKVLKN